MNIKLYTSNLMNKMRKSNDKHLSHFGLIKEIMSWSHKKQPVLQRNLYSTFGWKNAHQ